MWSRFVQAVRTMLGLPAHSDTALSEVLRVSENLLEQRNPSAYYDFETPSKKMSVQQPSGSWGHSKVSGLTTAKDKLESIKNSNLVDGARQAYDGILRLVRPEARTPGAKEFASELREGLGTNETERLKYMTAINKAAKQENENLTRVQKARDLLSTNLTAAADRMFVGKKEESYAFMQAMDSDDKSFLAARPEYEKMADVIRSMWSDLAEKVQGLDTGALQNLRDN